MSSETKETSPFFKIIFGVIVVFIVAIIVIGLIWGRGYL